MSEPTDEDANPGREREVRLTITSTEAAHGHSVLLDIEHRYGPAPSPIEILGLLEFAKEWELEQIRKFNAAESGDADA